MFQGKATRQRDAGALRFMESFHDCRIAHWDHEPLGLPGSAGVSPASGCFQGKATRQRDAGAPRFMERAGGGRASEILSSYPLRTGTVDALRKFSPPRAQDFIFPRV